MFRPEFRYTNGVLQLADTQSAVAFRKNPKTVIECARPEIVRRDAMVAVHKLGGNTRDELNILGFYKFQGETFGGQTFKWLLENTLGYSAHRVKQISGVAPSTSPLSHNMQSFRKYLESFKEGREAIQLQSQLLKRRHPTAAASATSSRHRVYPATITAKSVTTTAAATTTTTTAAATTKTTRSTRRRIVPDEEYVLPDGWKQSLPVADRHWISKALFRRSKTGRPELIPNKLQQLWLEPPQPEVLPTSVPNADVYFCHRLLL